MKSTRWLVIGGAACAACCAPLLAPLLAWAGLAGAGAAVSGWAAGLNLEQIACITFGVILAVAGVALAVRFLRRRSAVAACEIGGPCDPSTSGQKTRGS